MKTYYTFKNCRDFERFLRTKEYKSGELDYVTIGKSVYTMHEYDNAGRTITWANKRTGRMIELTTTDRYTLGYKDAKVIAYPSSFLREDISYAE